MTFLFIPIQALAWRASHGIDHLFDLYNNVGDIGKNEILNEKLPIIKDNEKIERKEERSK